MKLDNFFRHEKVNGKSDSTIKNHKSFLEVKVGYC